MKFHNNNHELQIKKINVQTSGMKAKKHVKRSSAI